MRKCFRALSPPTAQGNGPTPHQQPTPICTSCIAWEILWLMFHQPLRIALLHVILHIAKLVCAVSTAIFSHRYISKTFVTGIVEFSWIRLRAIYYYFEIMHMCAEFMQTQPMQIYIQVTSNTSKYIFGTLGLCDGYFNIWQKMHRGEPFDS